MYVTSAEIERIWEVDLSNWPELVHSRNEFVLGCLTGLRFSDFQALQEVDYRNGRLYKKQKNQDIGSSSLCAQQRNKFLIKDLPETCRLYPM